MEDIRDKKRAIREDVRKKLKAMPEEERLEKIRRIENRLFDFANFLESKIPLLYMNLEHEIPTRNIIRKSYDFGKIVVLPAFKKEKHRVQLFKVDDPDAELKTGPRGVPEPDKNKCKVVPIDRIDIALAPGLAFDEKGGRIGSGEGYYDRLIPRLPVTARKVALTFELQIVSMVPMASHDKYVDIIISEDRIIYKI